MEIRKVTNFVNRYMAHFDVFTKDNALETSIVCINETMTALSNLKESIKQNKENISVADFISLCMQMSEETKSIQEFLRLLSDDRKS